MAHHAVAENLPTGCTSGSLMRLVDEWRWLVRRAWSVRLLAIAAALSGLEVTIQVMIGFSITPPIDPGIFAILSGLVTVAALIARFVAQTRD
jgi:hypothetical protein